MVALLEDRAGDLWLGTNGGGLVCRTAEGFKSYTTQNGLANNFVSSLAEDGEGNLWIGTLGAGLMRFRSGRFDVFTTKDGLPNDYVHALVGDGRGGLWIGTNSGLALFKDARFTVYSARQGLPNEHVSALWLDRAGRLWVGTLGGGLARFAKGQFVDGGLGQAQARISALYEDREGGLWIGTDGGGLALLKDGHFSYHAMADGLSSDAIRSIYQDAEGDLWIGTLDGGLCQLRFGRFGVYTMRDGLPHDFAQAIFEDLGGSVWVGTSGGLARFKDGSVTAYTTRDGLPENGGSSITADQAGNLWVSARGKLARFRERRFIAQPLENDQAFNSRISVVLGDRAGNLWIATRGSGLNLYRDGRFTLYTTADGLAHDDIMSLYEDRQGALWIGTLRGGVSRFKDGRFTSWTTKDGLASDHILSFYEDRWGSVWIGTSEGGLARFRDGKFVTISVKDGLYDNLAFQILSDTEDDSDYLWFSCNKGIYRVRLQELNDFADGRIQRVNSYVYGVADGMLSRECNGGAPAGWKTRDGRLWFPTAKGVVVINPQQRDLQPPRVAIEQVAVDRASVPIKEPLQIKPGQERLEIQYTALSWSRPQQVRFRYQLEGLDHQWIEAGARRTAYYSHLPPGAYNFRVIADNGEGVWNWQGQSLRVIVLPPFYRRWWFTVLVVFSAAAAVWFAWRYRIAQLTRAQVAQQAFSRQLIESQERERKRIAAELHDSLGQTLLIIKNRAFLGTRASEQGGAPSARLEVATEQLTEISDSAAAAINQVREIAYHLRPAQLERLGLTAALEEMIEQIAAASGLQIDSVIAPLDGVFSQDSEINFYRIAQESLNNVVKHAGASEVSFIVRRVGRGVELRVQDNGQGFEPNAAAGARSPGFGLTGIAERARMLGGTYTIESVKGRGTTVIVRIASVPPATARE